MPSSPRLAEGPYVSPTDGVGLSRETGTKRSMISWHWPFTMDISIKQTQLTQAQAKHQFVRKMQSHHGQAGSQGWQQGDVDDIHKQGMFIIKKSFIRVVGI